MAIKQTLVFSLSAASLVLGSGLTFAAGQDGPGVSHTEIKLGNTMAYSGSASSYGAIGKSDAAYFAMIKRKKAGRWSLCRPSALSIGRLFSEIPPAAAVAAASEVGGQLRQDGIATARAWS
jgi:hypothetical protein